MKKPTAEQVIQIIEKVISVETPWSDISSAVKSEFEIKNFMTQVRGPLQYLLDAGKIVRVKNIPAEKYSKV